jgi:tetratricopeptide (TPR) repeat protein
MGIILQAIGNREQKHRYVKSGKFEKAIGAFKKAIEIKPDFDEAYYSMGIAYTMLNEF